MTDQLALFDLSPRAATPAGRRVGLKLTFAYDPDEWAVVLRLAARLGQRVEAVGEEAMRRGLAEMVKEQG